MKCDRVNNSWKTMVSSTLSQEEIVVLDPNCLTNPTVYLPNPTIHHSGQKCAYLCSEWCIVGCGTGALWDWSIVCTRWRHYMETVSGLMYYLMLGWASLELPMIWDAMALMWGHRNEQWWRGSMTHCCVINELYVVALWTRVQFSLTLIPRLLSSEN